MKRMLVSVIIPFFNAELYIHKCLESIESQTFKDFEVLCIDDGSTDNSAVIVNEYCNQDKRFRLIQCKKTNAGNARNVGLAEAVGKYVIFLDADDWFESDMIETAVKESEKHELEIFIWNVDENDNLTGEINSNTPHFRKELLLEGKKVFSSEDQKYLFNFVSGAPCNKMYLKSFIINNSLSYSNSSSYNDLYFTYAALLSAKRIYCVEEVFTHYRVNNENSLQGKREKSFSDALNALNDIYDYLKERKIEKKEIIISFFNFVVSFLGSMIPLLLDNNNMELIKAYIEKSELFNKIRYIDVFHFYQEEWMRIERFMNVNEKNISVIVPTYNDEYTISNCLDSLVCQNLPGLEFIIVDDCSSDNTYKIVCEYAEKDERFVVLQHEENLSPFQARKDGVFIAKGKYLMFVDADDSLVENACQELWELEKEEHFDIIHFGTNVVTEITDKKRIDGYKKLINPREEVLFGKSIFDTFVERNFEGHLWNKIFFKDLAKEVLMGVDNIILPKGQDKYFYWMMAFFAKTYKGIPNLQYYNYYYGAGVEGKADYGLKEFDLFCKQAWTENAIEHFMISNKAEQIYESAITKSRRNLLNHSVQQLEKLAQDQKAFAMNHLLEFWTREGDKANIVATLCNLYRDKLEELVDIFSDIKMSKRETIRTIGTYYHFYSNGGIQRVLAQLMRIWVSEGYRVVFFTDYPESEDDYELPNGVERVTLAENGNVAERNYGKRGLSLESNIRKYNVDVMVYHEYFGRSMIWDMLLSKMLGCPFLIYYHNTFSKFVATYEKQFFTIPRIAKLADGMIVLSDTDKQFWSAFNSNVHVVKNPLVFELDKIQINNLKNKIIIWVGRLDELHKRYQEPIDVMKLLLKRVPDAKLVIVGRDADGTNYYKLKNRIEKLHMEDSVILCGFQKDVAPFYEMASIYLMTSNFEGYPMTLIEALSYGIPTVMYELPYLTLTQNNKGIISVKQGKTELLAHAIEELLCNEELRITTGKAARYFIENLYSKENLGARWNEILESCLVENVEIVSNYVMETLVRHFELSYERNMREFRYYNRQIETLKNEVKDLNVQIEKITDRDFEPFIEKTTDYERKLEKYQEMDNELNNDYLYQLLETRKSMTYKIGRVITFVPRVIRHLLTKKPM